MKKKKILTVGASLVVAFSMAITPSLCFAATEAGSQQETTTAVSGEPATTDSMVTQQVNQNEIQSTQSSETVIKNDETGIPDPEFYELVVRCCDRNSDGVLTVGEAEGLKMLNNHIIDIMHIDFNNIKSIQGIQYLKNLVSVSIQFDDDTLSYSISDLTPLSGLTNLESLSIEGEFSDLTPLSGLTNLKGLYLKGNFSDLTPLSGLTNLTNLDLASKQMNDITLLSSFTNLTDLSVEGNISDLTPLSGLTNLKYVTLKGNISDLTPLSSFTNVTLFSVEGNFSDLTPLSGFINLKVLYLKGNFSDLTPLSGLTNLTNLHLASKQMNDITPLENLMKLSTLKVDYSQISDITPLENIEDLHSIEIWNSQISDLTPIKSFKHYIEYLCLNNNRISDLTPLENLSIQTLSLDNNQISDITPLANLSTHTLSLNNNQISDISSLANMERLCGLKLNNNKINNIDVITTLPRLSELDLTNNNITILPDLTEMDLDVNYTSFKGNRITVTEARAKLPQDLINYYYNGESWFLQQEFISDSPSSIYNGIDYSAVYDMRYYVTHNPDVVAAFGTDPQQLIWHFVTYGMAEGRCAKENFNVVKYMYGLLNDDLRAAYGGDMEQYYYHYMNYGQYEGRSVSDWDSVFDAEYYLNANRDVRENIVSRYTGAGNLYGWALWHYCEYGANEGRHANASFGVLNYEAANPDVYAAYGSNLKAATIHYLQFGHGRLTQPVDGTDIYSMPTKRADVVSALGINNPVSWVGWYINYGSKGM